MDDSIKKQHSQRVEAVQTPIIPTITQLARENPGTISLGQGVAYYAHHRKPMMKFKNNSHLLSSMPMDR